MRWQGDEVKSITPEALLGQLDEEVALLVATPAEQTEWAIRTGFPSEEIALQLYDAVSVFLARLRENALIDSRDEQALHDLVAYLGSVQVRLFEAGPGVTEAPEWARVRELAEATLDTLRRPAADKQADG